MHMAKVRVSALSVTVTLLAICSCWAVCSIPPLDLCVTMAVAACARDSNSSQECFFSGKQSRQAGALGYPRSGTVLELKGRGHRVNKSNLHT